MIKNYQTGVEQTGSSGLREQGNALSFGQRIVINDVSLHL